MELTPTVPLPATLVPGTYYLEASAWTLPAAAANPGPERTGRTASCARVVVVEEATTATGSMRLIFRPGNRGCTLTLTTSATASP